MKIFILMSLVLLSSCGKLFQPDVVYTNERYFKSPDPYFTKLTQAFEQDYYIETGKEIKVSIPINFSNTIFFKDNPDSIGVCFSGKGSNEVLINTDYWQLANISCRKQLFYHELGHCVLDQDHRDQYLSIMNPTNAGCHKMILHENMLVKELMKPTNFVIEYLKSL